MADFDRNAKRSFVQAAELALQSVSGTQCEKCGGANGQPYLFHYARRGDVTQEGNVTTTAYTDIGARAVLLCGDCVMSYFQARRQKWISNLLKGLIPALILLVPTVYVFSASSETGIVHALLMAALAILGLWVIALLVNYKEYTSPQRAGRSLARAMVQSSLAQEGYDLFWHDLDVDKMRSEIGSAV